jgi:hypothetical protein
MTTTTVTEMEPGWFGVQVEDGDITTSHRIRLSRGLVDDLLLDDADPARIVEESVGFLLERVAATSIPAEVSLDQVTRDYPEYPDELRLRLGGAP